MPRQQLL